jgi:glutathione reductase (NADPH)
MADEFDYDLFVIGGGSGGARAARMAAQYGAKVAIAEEYRVGGTCVVRGCVPKKLLVYGSHFAEEFEDAAGYGWSVKGARFDWKRLIANKDAEIDRLNRAYIAGLEKAGAEVIQSRAELRDAHSVFLVAGENTVTAATILIATGAAPFVPQNVPGCHFAITSNDAFHLETLPDSIAIIGGSYIAVEFAGIFNGLGVETLLLYRGEQILRGFDDDLRNALAGEMRKKGVDVRAHANVGEIRKAGERFEVVLPAGETVQASLVMYATGRVPNTLGLGLENAGIRLDGRGAVAVDRFSRTNVDNIYAVGDVTDRVNLTPVAIREGAAFAETVFNDNPTAVDHSDVPTAVFSQPEIGTIGLTEAEARAAYPGVKVYKSSFRPMKHTLSGRDETMLMKLVVEEKSDRVLGCHILGAGAAEMIQLVGIAIKMGATKRDFDATMAVHPTAAEELVTLG